MGILQYGLERCKYDISYHFLTKKSSPILKKCIVSFLCFCKKKRAEFYYVGCEVFFISYMVFLKGPSCLISKNVSATPITRNPLNNLNHSPATLFHTFLTFLLFFHGNFISKFHNAIAMLSSWFWNILKCNISLLQLTGDVWRIYLQTYYRVSLHGSAS